MNNDDVEALYEYATEQDRFVDYCLWPYAPRVPAQGMFRSYNLLLHSFLQADADPQLFKLCQTIREALGEGQVVWGVKQAADGHLSWELYFYDYARLERKVSISALLQAISPFADCHLNVSEQRPYFMFSIDVDNALALGRRSLEEVNVYIGNPGSSVSSGLCYSLTQAGMAFTNLYYFYNAKNEMDEIKGKIACSAYLDLHEFDMAHILWPELCHCEVIVVANKQDRDGVYFSRIPVDGLIFFLKKMAYPAALIEFIERNRSRLEHLLFDVGFDYRMKNGRIDIVKSAYYGFF